MTQPNSIERRAATRVDVDFPAHDRVQSAPLRVRDLSLSGARFSGAAPRAPGTVLDIDLTLPGQTDPLRVRGAVAASGEGGLRVRFLDVRKWQMVKLAEALW